MEATTEQAVITPRPRQRKAARAVVKNLQSDKPASLGKVLESVGYSPTSAAMPTRITESLGFKQALRDMGLTEELITTSLVEDIEKKKQNRLGELRLGAELLGLSKPKDEPVAAKTVHTYNFIFSPETQASIKQMEDALKAKLIEPHANETQS